MLWGWPHAHSPKVSLVLKELTWAREQSREEKARAVTQENSLAWSRKQQNFPSCDISLKS